MKRLISGAIATAVMAMAMVGLTATSAVATHPLVSGVAKCNTSTGLFDIVWTVGGDAGYPDVTAEVVSQSTPTNPTFVGREFTGSETGTAVVRGQAAGTYELTVGVQFDNHANGDIVYNTGTVLAEGDCVKDEPEVEKASFRVVAYCNTAVVEGRHNVKSITHRTVGDRKHVFVGHAKRGSLFSNGTNTLRKVVLEKRGGSCGSTSS